MRRFVLAAVALAGFLGLACLLSKPANAQDLPPEILVDQYLLEAKRALEDTTLSPGKRAERALSPLENIEALEIEPPLEFVFLYGRVLLVRTLEYSKANRSYINDYTVLYDALSKGQSLLKQYVIKGGKNADHYTSALELLSAVRSQMSDFRNKALASAAKKGDVAAIEALIAAGANNKHAPLADAAEAGQVEAMKVLITAGAIVKYGAIRRAAEAGQVEAMKVLIAAGANVNAADINDVTPLNWAARLGHIETAKVLIDAGADVNDFGAISKAAEAGQVEAIELLIAAGADVDDLGVLHSILRHWHSDYPKWNAIKTLIAAGADVNAKSENFRRIPLCYAAEWPTVDGNPEAIRMLIAAGADVNAKTSEGETALVRAACSGNDGVARVLIAAGADLNEALHITVLEDIPYAASYLIDWGADVNARNSSGKRPRRVALDHGYARMAETLKNHGGKK